MLITQPNLEALFITFSMNFKEAYMSEPTPLLTSIGTTISSGSADQKYPFVQSISGAMREWKGERETQNIVVDNFTVKNLKWENTLSIQRTAVEDDQFGVYTDMLIPNLARHAKLLPDQQIASTIEANDTGYDGVNFFSASHPIDPSNAAKSAAVGGATTQSNIFASGTPLNDVNLAKAQARMMSFAGPDGLPLGCYGDTLLVPPSLKYTADVLANSTFYPAAMNGATAGQQFAAQTNVFQGQYKVVTSPWLTDTGNPATATWYLLDCRYANMRPFFWQMREAPQLVQLIDPSNPVVFLQDVYMMGARMRGAAAASLWFKAVQAIGT
jgi:phage major head subunit gpT-like protein